jgi:hypothetical protein
MATARRRVSVNITRMSASVDGISDAPDNPIRTRAAMS